MERHWTFNNQIAQIFDKHARQHIPDYDRVIDLSINLCKQKVEPAQPILELGCAVGETVKRLHKASFSNIHAVDNSQAMLDSCPADLATYYHSSTIPQVDIKFNAVICNWTLHFIKNKESYLQDIYNCLAPGGIFILSEKVENQGLALEQYHQFKRTQGVSDEEIAAKAKSLEGVMFVDSVDWYMSALQTIGFNNIYTANSNWCFTTLVAIK